jgi:glycosyltransferase involved in cell wall biosynthesis
MKRLAIVSSYNEECGAAFYSSRLKKHFEASGYEVTVKRLPVSLLRVSSPVGIRRKGDLEIARIANEVADYDAVCLQFEPGLYGTTPKSSYRRVRQILAKAKQAIITVHGFDRHASATSAIMGVYQALTFHPRAAWHEFKNLRISSEVEKFWIYVRKAQHVKVLTFCKADQVLLQRHFDLPRVDNYPITYFDQGEVESIRSSVDRQKFLKQFGLDPRKKYFAVCGFLSRYKGHFTAMKALEFLPDDWNLVVLGGEHPHGIEADKDIGGYVQQLLAFSTESEKSDPLGGMAAPSNSNTLSSLVFGSDRNRQDIRDELFKKSDFRYFLPKVELTNRIKFLGQVSDEEMPKFYAALDYVVHPYMKTKSGQSGSGPATMALEFGAKSLFTNVPVFREMNSYFTDSMHFFNVGNFIELAEALQRHDEIEGSLRKNREAALKIYNPVGMVEAYRTLMEA